MSSPPSLLLLICLGALDVGRDWRGSRGSRRGLGRVGGDERGPELTAEMNVTAVRPILALLPLVEVADPATGGGGSNIHTFAEPVPSSLLESPGEYVEVTYHLLSCFPTLTPFLIETKTKWENIGASCI